MGELRPRRPSVGAWEYAIIADHRALRTSLRPGMPTRRLLSVRCAIKGGMPDPAKAVEPPPDHLEALRRRVEVATATTKASCIAMFVALVASLLQMVVLPRGHWAFMRITVPLASAGMLVAAVAEIRHRSARRALDRAQRR